MNSASYVATAIAPGELVTIEGVSLGPSTPAVFALNGGTIGFVLGGTSVLFDDIPAPILYASPNQVNAIVPFAIAGRERTNLVVKYNGILSSPLPLTVSGSAPGIFTSLSSGIGQGSILNQDYGPNGASNRAAKSSVVQIFLTGGGVTNPSAPDGTLAPSNSLQPLTAPIVVTMGGQPTRVLFAGSAPGLVEGVVQINAEVPNAAPSGRAVPVVVTIDGVASSPTVTMAIQ